MSELVALLDGEEIGTVRQERGRLSFSYRDAWRVSPRAYPLSLSLPLAGAEHGHAPVSAFLWGLLPDNALVLERWGKQFRVSARNPFGLLGAVGEDCAGAVQFVAPERVTELKREKGPTVEWLSKREVAARLRTLTGDVAAWRSREDAGQFSLAGAQPKTALYFEDGRFGVPHGRTPTTHILKPTLPTLAGHDENEHLCLSLARSLGLPTASSRVEHFDVVTAIVLERYDRVRLAGTVRRVHQEDLCQALGRPPSKKYESDGGPGAVEIVKLLRGAVNANDGETTDAAETDVLTFVDALALNWLFGGTDAHAKNYSLLIGPGQVRLAPLYDMASIFAYPDVSVRRAKLAMKIDGRYRLEEIHAASFRAFAPKLGLDAGALAARLHALATALPDALSTELGRMRRAGVDHPVLARIQREMTKRALRAARAAAP
jgi:serine/threonine-protein kinase HipA